jgi:phage FluMu protein Com
MAVAAVLPFPGDRSQKIGDLQTQIVDAGVEALKSVVGTLMDKFKGKDFHAISEMLREKGQEITGAMFSKLLNAVANDDESKARCPQCKEICGVHSKSQRTVESLHGDLKVERPYFYCNYCSIGFAPFDVKMKLAPQKKQYDLQAGAAELLAEVPYDTASRLFKRLTGRSITDHTLHELGSRLGETARKENVLPSRKLVETTIEEFAAGRGWRPVMVVSADGAHEPTRPETGKRSGKRGPSSFQEAKGFRIYLVGDDRIEQIMSWHQIANEEEFGEAIRFAATLIPQDQVRIALIADGAKWIWPHLTAAFPNGQEILDYYHCSEHIHKLAELQYPKDEARQVSWIESSMARLYCGDVTGVIWGLQRMQPHNGAATVAIESLIGYLENNEHRIDYKKLKRGQYPIGSGGIESANKFICHVRLKRSGAWWYKINGNRMLRLRCAMYNGTFDEVFARYKRVQVAGSVKPPKTSRNA